MRLRWEEEEKKWKWKKFGAMTAGDIEYTRAGQQNSLKLCDIRYR